MSIINIQDESRR